MVCHSESIIGENLLEARIARTEFRLTILLVESIEVLETSHIRITDYSFLALIARIFRCKRLEMSYNASDRFSTQLICWLMFATFVVTVEEVCEFVFMLERLQQGSIAYREGLQEERLTDAFFEQVKCFCICSFWILVCGLFVSLIGSPSFDVIAFDVHEDEIFLSTIVAESPEAWKRLIVSLHKFADRIEKHRLTTTNLPAIVI